MNREDNGVDYRKLLTKYMQNIVVDEGYNFVYSDDWCGYTKAEYLALVEISQKERINGTTK